MPPINKAPIDLMVALFLTEYMLKINHYAVPNIIVSGIGGCGIRILPKFTLSRGMGRVTTVHAHFGCLKSVFHKFHFHAGNPARPDLIVSVIVVFYEKIPDQRIRKEPK